MRCSKRCSSGRAVSTTWTFSHSLLKRRKFVGVASSARTPSRNAGSASTASSAAPARPSAGFQLASPSTGYGEARVKSIDNGQHDTWPSIRRPRAFAAAIASRSANTAVGLTLLCRSAATITGRPVAAASDSRKGMGVCPPLVSM